jgi:hypothetical protein
MPRVEGLGELAARDPEVVVPLAELEVRLGPVGAVAGLHLEERALVGVGLAETARHVDELELAVGSGAAIAKLEVPGPVDPGVRRIRVDVVRRKRNPGYVVA